MDSNASSSRSFVISYLGLRRAIGIIGLLLPFVLSVGRLFTDGMGIESSISSYYYSGMRDVFVGAMCAIGIFLFSYCGYDDKDAQAGNLAALFAIGLALVPTAPDFTALQSERIIGAIHLAFASGFFLTLTYFCLFLFTKTHPTLPPTAQKLQRNIVYKTCGSLIAISLLAIVLVKQFPMDGALMPLHPVFWLEAIAVVAFGVSWLVKGEAILKDEEAVTV